MNSGRVKKVLITGGAGFIGSAVVRQFINETDVTVVSIDALTYAGNLEFLKTVSEYSRYFFERANICDKAVMERIFREYKPDAVMHLAAESHVDRFIDSSAKFIETNLVGTYTLLILYLKLLDSIGRSVVNYRLVMMKNHLFFTMFPLMKYLVHWGKMGCLLKRLSTNQTHLTLPAKHPLTTWCEPGIIHMVYPLLVPIAQITMDRISFLKN